MTLRTLAVVALCASGPALARAEPPPAIADTPLLPAKTAEPEFTATVVAPGAPYATATLLSAGFDWAVTRRFQVGLAIAQSVSPDAAYTAVAVDGLVALGRGVAVRCDLEAERAPFVSGRDVLGATVGLGFPLRLSLGRFVALTSGSSRASAFLAPSFLAPDDLVVFSLGGDLGSVGLPVGAVWTPVRFVSLAVRSGYRRYLLRRLGLGEGPDAVPLAVDLTATPLGWLDLGFTFALPGRLRDPSCIPACPERGWSSVKSYQTSLRARF